VSFIVVDSSVAMTWCLTNQRTPVTESVLRALAEASAIVPALWWSEVTNVTALAERRGYIGAAERERFFALIRGLRISAEPSDPDRTCGPIYELAQSHGLTIYDATYLEIAKRSAAPLASLDAALCRAAVTERVRVFS
jgi:predicted nucleic acid-binding protein